MRRWLGFAGVAVCGLAWAGEPVWPNLSEAPAGSREGAGDAAVLIGIEDYAFVSDILGARQNVQDWQAWLLRTRGVPPGSIVRRVDKEATDRGMRAAVEEGLAQVKPGGTLWLIYIGHGAPTPDGKDGMLVGADAQDTPDGIYDRSVPRADVMSRLATGPQANTVVILDACFAGKGVDGADLVTERLAPLVAVGSASTPPSITVLTATSDNQFAGLLPGRARPAFSYLVLGALRGWGDANQDGAVLASEAKEYARGALNLVVTGRRQVPEAAGPDVVLGRGREAGPDLASMSVSVAPIARPASAPVGAAVAGGFSDLAIDVSAQLREQQCGDQARARGAAARAIRLDAMALQAQAEARAAWSRLAPQGEQCAALTDSAARGRCAVTIEAFVDRAVAMEAALPAAVEPVQTDCGERAVAFVAEARAVAVPEVDAARTLAARLRSSPATIERTVAPRIVEPKPLVAAPPPSPQGVQVTVFSPVGYRLLAGAKDLGPIPANAILPPGTHTFTIVEQIHRSRTEIVDGSRCSVQKTVAESPDGRGVSLYLDPCR